MNKILNREDCFLYGHIRKAIGFKGALKIVRDDDKELNRDNIPFLFLGLEDGLIPFMVEEFHEAGGLSLEVKLTDVNTLEATTTLLNIPVYLPLDYLADDPGPEFDGDGLVGMTVKDLKLGLLGVVDEIIHYSHQSLIKVRREKSDILVPLVPEIIVDVDYKLKMISVELPEGLAELNS